MELGSGVVNKEVLKRIGSCVSVMDPRFAPLAANTDWWHITQFWGLNGRMDM